MLEMHPSGRYLLYTRPGESRSGKTVLADLFDLDENNKIRQISTRLNGEAYPVEPNWDYISAPYHENGMDYVPFEDLLLFGESARPAFSDNEHDEWYQSAGEIPGRRENIATFRTLLFSGQRTRDYRVKRQGNAYDVEKSEVYSICSEIEGDGKKAHQSLTNNLSKLSESYYNAETEKERESLRDQARQIQSKLADLRYFTLAGRLDQPILSKDGTEVAGNVRGETRIFSILDKNRCKEVENLGNLNSKVSFSYPVNGSAKYITYSKHVSLELGLKDDSKVSDYNKELENRSYFSGGVPVVFDREKKEEIILYDLKNDEQSGGSYPNFTKDGRVIFVSSGKVVVVDPNQYRDGEGSSSCIKRKNLPSETPEIFGGTARARVAPGIKNQEKTN